MGKREEQANETNLDGNRRSTRHLRNSTLSGDQLCGCFGGDVMEAITYNYVDKSDWERGEWDSEPDKVQFVDSKTKLPCLMVRGPSGALCGYVGVPKGHPLYGKGCGDESVYNLSVHGGVTYAAPCQHREDNLGICHIPGEGEPDDVWWIGFDCAHAGDLCPSYYGKYGMYAGQHYRNTEYVKYEIEALAQQIKEAANEMA